MDQQHPSKYIEEFLEKVRGQIKSKEAKCVVEQELQAHIQQRKQEYLEKGLSDAEAAQQVINQMGNPITLGKEMHRIHKPKIDWVLIGLFSLLLIFGIVPMYTMNVEYLEHAFINKAFYSVVSLCIVIGLMFFDYRKIKHLWPWLFSIALLICILMGYSHYLVKGQMYLAIGIVNINQWFISLLFVLGLAGFLSVQISDKKKIIISFVMIWIPLYFFLLAGSIPLSIFYLITAFLIILVSSLPKKVFRKIIMLNSVVLIIMTPLLLLNLKAHQIARLTSFINPEADPGGYGYIYIRIREYIEQATLWGNKSTIAPIPEMHTDLIFPYIVYSYGWFVSGCLIACLALFLSRMLAISKESNDPLGRMLIMASVSMIGLAAIWNIGMVIGVLPITGVPLPFISYGGQFLVIYAVYIGLILSVNRRKHLVQISKKGDLA